MTALTFAVSVSALLTGCSCGGEDEAPEVRTDAPRLVVLFAVCTMNRDYLSPYNPEVTYTPTLDQIARAGVVFERHHTESGQSGTSFASLFTGAQADTHGIYTHPNELKDGLLTLAECFAQSGWDPWYWHGHPMAAPKLNYAQGVPPKNQIEFKKRVLSLGAGANKRIARLTPHDPDLMRLLARIKEDESYRAVIQLNFSYTHGPYVEGRQRQAFETLRRKFPDEVPMSYQEMEQNIAVWNEDRVQLQWNFQETRERLGLTDEQVADMATAIEIAYKSGVYMLDMQLAQFLRAVQLSGLQDELLLAFTADHGEALYSEQALFQWTHGLELRPEVINVPLIMYSPKLLEPVRYPGVTRSMDVYPTLAGLVGVDVPRGSTVTGVDLTPSLVRMTAPLELVAFSHSTTINPRMFKRTKKWTLLNSLFPGTGPENLWVCARKEDMLYKWRSHVDATWNLEVFDLASDPTTTTDLFDETNAQHATMRGKLQDYKERLVRGFATHEGPDDSEDRLRDLGYIGGDEEEDAEPSSKGTPR
jgi:arylsulfatase A-like enzyme